MRNVHYIAPFSYNLSTYPDLGSDWPVLTELVRSLLSPTTPPKYHDDADTYIYSSVLSPPLLLPTHGVDRNMVVHVLVVVVLLLQGLL